MNHVFPGLLMIPLALASCVGEAPRSEGRDGDLGVAQEAFQVTCYGKCNNSEVVSGWSNEWPSMAEALANAKGQVLGYCGQRGGLQEYTSCQ